MRIKRLIFSAALLLTVASGAWAEAIPQVIWCSGNSTLYFTCAEPVTQGSSYQGYTADRVYSESSLDYGTWANNSDITGYCTTVVFESSFSSARPTKCNYWFLSLGALTTIQGIAYLNTSEVTSMNSMFANCVGLTTLDLSHFNTAKVTDMESMFQNCTKLTTLDLSTFDTSKVETMSSMFRGCSALTTLTVASGWTKITSYSNRFDNCTPSTINLIMDDDGDSQSLLEEFSDLISGNTVNVTLRNRKLYKDGDWNTLCLPFNVTLTGSPLAGATLKELVANQSNLADDGKLTLTFTDATNIEAGKPYLIKWESGSDIENPSFNGVTITSNAPTAVTFANAQGGGACSFVGQYKPFVITSSNKNTIVMLSSGSRIGYSNNVPRTLRSMRAHFVIPTTTSAPAMTDYAIDFDGEASTAMKAIENGQWVIDNVYYDLAGRRVVQPTKGLYISNGKKVMIP